MAVLSALFAQRLPTMNWLIGLSTGTAIGLVAWRLGWLTLPGALAAAMVGGAYYAGAGWPGACALITFFITGSLLSRLRDVREGPRSAWQVLANGGVGAAFAASGHTMPAFCAIATACADTWSTEIGMRFGRAPRNVITLRIVAPGASGGVTLAGLVGAAIGASVVAAWDYSPIILAIGFFGSVFDSVLGAVVQGRFRCSVCGCQVEERTHCETAAALAGGVPWIRNDAVNFLTTLVAGFAGWLAAGP